MSIRRSFMIGMGSTAIACAANVGCSATGGSNGNSDFNAGGASGSGGFAPTGGTTSQPSTGSNPPMTMNPAPGAGGTSGIGAGGSPVTTPPLGVGGTAGSGAAPAAGGTPATMPTTPPNMGTCPAPPAGTPANAVQAATVLNQVRLAAGSSCMNVVSALVTSATAHCSYEAANANNPTCTADPHGEVKSCTGFTGADAQSREVAAGYSQFLAYTEVLTTYGNNPAAAVPGWIDTVWHRIPLLDPWTVDMGYGGGAQCDIIDIGIGTSTAPASTVVVYPYDGQTNVPPSFSGLEGPAPPAPSGGFPSSYPINIYAKGIQVTDHELTKDGDPTPIDHLWLDAQSSLVSAGLKGYFTDTAFLYGAPFAPSTKYHVKIVGTHSSGTLDKEWSFTTGAANPFGR